MHELPRKFQNIKETTKNILRQDSETWHKIAVKSLDQIERHSLSSMALEAYANNGERFSDPRLNVTIDELQFDNPIGVAAGWTKNGLGLKGLYLLGAGHVEVGSVLPIPQTGNEKPRQWTRNGVAFNRLGFNSDGAAQVRKNVKRYDALPIPIQMNLGIPKELTDGKSNPWDIPFAYYNASKYLYDVSDSVTLNVSSPNTPGLRGLQGKYELASIIRAVHQGMDEKGKRKPLFVKIAPDITDDQLDDVIQVASDNNITGIVATNTTVDPNLKAKYYGEKWRNEAGGLSGNMGEFRERSYHIVSEIYKRTNAEIPIIGVGGVGDGLQAFKMIAYGANIVQVNTGIRGKDPLPKAIFKQPRFFTNAHKEVLTLMDMVGIKDVKQLRGIAIRHNFPIFP